MFKNWVLFHVIFFAFLGGVVTPAFADNEADWVESWAAAPDQSGPALGEATVRQFVRVGLAGEKLRLRFSNLYGFQPLTLIAVHVAMRADGSSIQSGSDHVVTFFGNQKVVIAQGQVAWSDPVDFPVQAMQELAVSIYLPQQTVQSTIHGVGLETAFIQYGRDLSDAIDMNRAKRSGSRYFLSDVEVLNPEHAQAIVALGDSIVDGVDSTPDQRRRWTDILSERLHVATAAKPMTVVNSGIAGNRILNNADDPFRGASILSRFDRDVARKPGVTWMIFSAGNNDLGAVGVLGKARAEVSAKQVIDGMKQLIAMAHVKGLKVVGTTLTPFGGADFGTKAHPYYTESAEMKRQTINQWIRTAHAFDAVVDFDAALRDPKHLNHIAPQFDSGDHIHPNDAGHKALAETFLVETFK